MFPYGDYKKDCLTVSTLSGVVAILGVPECEAPRAEAVFISIPRRFDGRSKLGNIRKFRWFLSRDSSSSKNFVAKSARNDSN